MLNRLTPFYQLDEADGGWNEVFVPNESAPADEEQPEMDSDAESLEEQETEEQDEVEPDSEEETKEAPTFDDDTEVDLGEGRQPVKFTELKQGYMRQSDYTKKTQELATQRKDMETQLEQVKPMQDWLAYAENNPYLWQQINQVMKHWNNTGEADFEAVMQDAEYAKWINGYQAELSKLAKENNELKAKYGDLEFGTSMDKALAELRSEYGELITPEYEQELREQAKSEGLKPDMVKRIAKGDLAEKKLQTSTKKAKEIEAETIQKMQEKRTSLPANPKSKGQTPQTQSKSIEDMSWAELLQG